MAIGHAYVIRKLCWRKICEPPVGLAESSALALEVDRLEECQLGSAGCTWPNSRLIVAESVDIWRSADRYRATLAGLVSVDKGRLGIVRSVL